MREFVKVVARLVDVGMDGEGNVHLILDIQNRDYARILIKLLRGYRNEDVKIDIRV